ncbi:MAG: DUF4340 domain-containing protein, partial [Pseudomonadota bacterium]
MKSGPLLHGAILLAAMIAALLTWTRDKSQPEQRRGNVPLWQGKAEQIELVLFENARQRITVERRPDGSSSYLWGSVKAIRKPPAKPTADAATATRDAGPGEAITTSPEEPAAETEAKSAAETENAREFPVGEAGEKLFERLGSLMANRDLGPARPEQLADLGFGESSAKMSVRIGSTTHELTIGSSVYGSSDRYAMSSAAGRVYIVPSDAVSPIENAEGSLSERKLHRFSTSDVAKVVIKAGGKEKVLVRRVVENSQETQWADAESPTQANQTLDNFMNRIDNLTPAGYASDTSAADLLEVGRLELLSAKGELLGFFE